MLYSKKYPRGVFKELEGYAGAELYPEEAPSDSGRGEFLKRLEDSVTYRPIPGREKGRAGFICMAVAMSELYGMDLEISENRSNLCARLSFGRMGEMRFLKPLIAMADDLGFEPGDGDMTMLLYYHTHAVYRGGRLVLPRGLEERGR